LAVKLRLRRMGKKKQPIYKVVAVDARAPRDGEFIEAVGYYNPRTNPKTVDLDEAKAMKWLNVGAQPTDTVRNLLRMTGISLKMDLIKRGLSEELIQAEMDKWKNSKKEAEFIPLQRQMKIALNEGTAEVMGAASVVESAPEPVAAVEPEVTEEKSSEKAE